MKQVCLVCERTSPDNNLYCQEIYCPAEKSPHILGYGEWLGDIEILKPVIILRSATIYQATHQQKRVYLKVAHPGAEHRLKLEREAIFLAQIQLDKQPNKFLPALLPAYANTTLTKNSAGNLENAYGKITLKGHLLYFYLFEYVEGEPLRDILLKNPQLWLSHVGWLMLNLSKAVAFLQNKDMGHFGLSPENILAHFDEPSNAPHTLLLDLGVASQLDYIRSEWYADCALPAYTAPEIINHTQVSYATDVYGLGLIFYELLVGEPAFTFKLRGDEEILKAVKQNRRIKMNRQNDVKPEVIQLVLAATDPQISRRPPDASNLAQQLRLHFGEVPLPKKSRWPSLRLILLAIGALLACAFLLALVVSLNNFM